MIDSFRLEIAIASPSLFDLLLPGYCGEKVHLVLTTITVFRINCMYFGIEDSVGQRKTTIQPLHPKVWVKQTKMFLTSLLVSVKLLLLGGR